LRREAVGRLLGSNAPAEARCLATEEQGRDALATNVMKSVETLPDYDRIAKLEAGRCHEIRSDVPAVLLRTLRAGQRLHRFLTRGHGSRVRRNRPAGRTGDNRVMGFVTWRTQD
jgi:hypothetical protein